MLKILTSCLIVVLSFAASGTLAEGRSVVFTEDVLVFPGEGYHAQVEQMNIGIMDDECVVQVYFPDGETEPYIYEDYEIQKVSLDGVEMTIMEIFDFAQQTCWPSY